MGTRSHLRSVVALGLAATMLASCQQGAVVEVLQRGGELVFTVSRPSVTKPVCVTSLDVLPAEPASAKPVWQIASEKRDPCTGRFVMGRVPDGFDSAGPPEELVKGRAYRVEASGTGFTGGTRFVFGDRTRK